MLNETNAETTRLRQRESSCRHAIFPGISIINQMTVLLLTVGFVSVFVSVTVTWFSKEV